MKVEEKKRVGREAFRLPRKVLTTLKGDGDPRESTQAAEWF